MKWTKKQPDEQADELKKQPNFYRQKLAIKVIADKIYDCRTTSTHKFRPKLGYTLHTFIWYTLHYLGIRAIISLAFWLIKLLSSSWCCEPKNSGFRFFTSQHFSADQSSTYADIFIENCITEENLPEFQQIDLQASDINTFRNIKNILKCIQLLQTPTTSSTIPDFTEYAHHKHS